MNSIFNDRLSRKTLLVTGSMGVVGRCLIPILKEQGYRIRCIDLKAPKQDPSHGDLLDRTRLNDVIDGCAGVIHLAAVSRVREAEQDPRRCWQVNVDGTRALLDAALAAPHWPWVLFASSREVYGPTVVEQVCEDHTLSPANLYGFSKALGESLITAAAKQGLHVGIVRLTNLYGSADDYPDRVVLSFVRRALTGEVLPIHGPEKRIDFLHISDALRGLMKMVFRLQSGEEPPPTIQLVSGVGISLGHLAQTIIESSGSTSALQELPAPPAGENSFVGDPSRASQVLGWQPRVTLDSGIKQLIQDVRVRLCQYQVERSST